MGQKKGYKQTDEHKRKKSEALKKAYSEGRHRGGFKKGNTALRMTGKKHSKETKLKQSLDKKINNPMFREDVRKKVSETRIRLGIGKGEKNHNWKGGITPENNRIRSSVEYVIWRKLVFKRDNYTCQKCGARSSKGRRVILNAEHVKSFADFPELRFNINNGITLCFECHKKTDNYGWKYYNKKS